MIRAFFPLVIPSLHSLAAFVLSLILGIIAAVVPVDSSLVVCTATLLFVATLIAWKLYHTTAFLFLTLTVGLLTGFLLTVHQLDQNRFFYRTYSGNTIDINGRIAAIERIQHPRFRYHIIITAEKIRLSSQAWENTSLQVALYTCKIDGLQVADLIEVGALAVRPITNTSFERYLVKEGIVATFFQDNVHLILKNRPYFSLSRTLFLWRKSILDTARNLLSRDSFMLYSSIFLGNRITVKKQMEHAKEPFKIWGTSHYLARSGLHVVIFVMIWHFLLGLIPLRFFWRQLILIAIILVYGLLSWSSISFVRAVLMFLIYKICVIFRTPSHYVHLILLVTTMVLLLNPLQLLFLDFQLSFGLTLALAWFSFIQAHKRRLAV